MLAQAPPPPARIVVVDLPGDCGTAPDITKVTVTTKKSGVVTFVVVFKTPFGKGSSFYVYIGNHGYRAGAGGLEMWDDASTAQDYEPLGSESDTFSVAPGGRALAVSFNLADIGNPKSFRFTATSLDGDGGPGAQDTASGTWRRR